MLSEHVLITELAMIPILFIKVLWSGMQRLSSRRDGLYYQNRSKSKSIALKIAHHLMVRQFMKICLFQMLSFRLK
jgi:hypothetical protein